MTAITLNNAAYGQFEGLKNKDYISKLKRENKIYDHALIMDQPDTQSVFAITNALRNYGLNKGDEEQIFNADYADITYIARKFPTQSQRIIYQLKSLIAREENLNNTVSEIKSRRFLANYYWRSLKEYERAFEEYLQLSGKLNKLPEEEYPLKSQALFDIGKAYFYFNEYGIAASFFKKVTKPSSKTKANIATGYKPSLNYLALIMQKMGKLDSSNYYLHILKNYAVENKDSTWMGIASGYLGYNLYFEGKNNAAVPFIKNGIDIALQVKDTGWVIRQKLWLADLYFKENNFTEAIPLVHWSHQNMGSIRTQTTNELYQLLYPLLAKQFASEGQHSRANLYLDSAIIFNDQLSREFSGLLLARAQQKKNIESEKIVVNEINAKANERNIVIAFLFILLIIAIYIHRLQQKKYDRKKQIDESLVRRQDLELTLATDQLKSFASMIANKNKTLETLQKQIGDIPEDLLPETLQKSSLFTNQDWDQFKILFEKVHSGFLNNLKEKHPELSPAEIRYMTLVKLRMSNKDMAYSLGISTESIRVTLHRLRKKLNLPADVNIETFVETI